MGPGARGEAERSVNLIGLLHPTHQLICTEAAGGLHPGCILHSPRELSRKHPRLSHLLHLPPRFPKPAGPRDPDSVDLRGVLTRHSCPQGSQRRDHAPRERRCSGQTLDASWSQCGPHRSPPGTHSKEPPSDPRTTTQQLSWEGEDSNRGTQHDSETCDRGIWCPPQSFPGVRSTVVVLKMSGRMKGWMDGQVLKALRSLDSGSHYLASPAYPRRAMPFKGPAHSFPSDFVQGPPPLVTRPHTWTGCPDPECQGQVPPG